MLCRHRECDVAGGVTTPSSPTRNEPSRRPAPSALAAGKSLEETARAGQSARRAPRTTRRQHRSDAGSTAFRRATVTDPGCRVKPGGRSISHAGVAPPVKACDQRAVEIVVAPVPPALLVLQPSICGDSAVGHQHGCPVLPLGELELYQLGVVRVLVPDPREHQPVGRLDDCVLAGGPPTRIRQRDRASQPGSCRRRGDRPPPWASPSRAGRVANGRRTCSLVHAANTLPMGALKVRSIRSTCSRCPVIARLRGTRRPRRIAAPSDRADARATPPRRRASSARAQACECVRRSLGSRPRHLRAS
jgi:hypothetical protein